MAMRIKLGDILTGYQTFQAARRLPELTSCRMRIECVPVTDIERARKTIADFAPNSGWIRFQSEVVCSRRGDGPWPDVGECIRKHGQPLYGELARDDGRSLHIRPDGKGGWRFFEFKTGEGKEFLAQRVCLLAEDQGLAALRYEVLWRIDGDVARQAAARFVGFSADGV